MLILWLFVLALLPFLVYPAALSLGASGSLGEILLSNTPLYSSAEMLWVFPRVVLLMLFAVPGLVWLRRNFSLDAFTKLVLAYSLLYLLSAWASNDDLQYVLLGGSGRMDGLLYSIGVVVFMLSGYLLARFAPYRMFDYFYVVVSVGAVLETGVLLTQRLGHDFMGPITIGKVMTGSLTGTIGNPGMLAGLILPTAMLSVGVASSEKFSRRMRLWAAFVAVVTAAGIAFTGNKSSFYGLLIVLAVYVFYQRSRTSLAVTALVVVTMFASPLLVPNRISYDHPLIPTSTVATRPVLWELTLKSIRHTRWQPFLGAGPDGLRLTILRNEMIEDVLKFYRISKKWPESRKVTSIKPVYSPDDPIRSRAYAVTFSDNELGTLVRVNLDKAHDMFLDRAVVSGVLSAVIWMILYLFPVFKLFKRGDALSAAIACSLAALFLYYLFWFPVPQVEPVHVGLLAIAWALVQGSGAVFGRRDENISA